MGERRSGHVLANDRLGSLQRVAVELAGALSPYRIAAVLASAAVEALGAESVVVGIWDEPGRHVQVVHERGLSPAAAQRLRAALGLLERTGRSDRPPLDTIAELLVPSRGRPPSSSGALATLMPPHERPIGIVLIGRAHGGPFSRQERRFLNTLVAVCAIALDHPAATRRRPSAGSHLQLADMQIDLADQEVVLGDHHVRLTPSELRILLFLAAEPGRARTRQEILRHVWHTNHVGDERACDAHISNLRRKIERDPSRPTRVVTVRRVGYALRVPATAADRRP